jgi:hypothetical protein
MHCLSRVRALKSYTGGRKSDDFHQNRNSTPSLCFRRFTRVLCLIALSVFLIGCKSTNPRVDYINDNSVEVTKYTSQHGEELGVLSSLIIQKCYFEVLDRKSNLTMSRLGKLALQGVVVYELSRDGKVIGAFYESKDRSKQKQKCIQAVALNYQLPASKELTYVYSKFELDVN